MIAKTIFAILLVVSNLPKEVFSFSDGIYLLRVLVPFLHWANIFESPSSISQARVEQTNNKRPTIEQMKYYNYYSAAAYCQYELNDLSCELCKKFKDDVDKHKVFMNNATMCTAIVTLSTRRKEIVVTFRGSANLINFYFDFNVFNVDVGEGRLVHKGFNIATMSLFYALTKYVKDLRKKHKNYKIVITGHSLGGSMARLTLFHWCNLESFPGAAYEIYTYGEPRTGNEKYSDYMNQLYIISARITHRADIAPHYVATSFLGFRIIADYYVHCMNEFWNEGDSGVFCNNHVREDPKCSNSLGPVYSLADHVVYFNVNYATCGLNQPAQILAIPNLLQPVGTIPKLPKFIQNILSFLINLISYPVAYLG